MDENLNYINDSQVLEQEPDLSDNSASQENTDAFSTEQDSFYDGESLEKDPTEELILGKFRSVEDLSKAYLELQRHQGENSKELGELRKGSNSMENLLQTLIKAIDVKDNAKEYIESFRQKYNTPEYFQNDEFNEIFKEAYMALGQNLDTDRFINLLEKYVGSRINAYDKANAAKKETQKALDSMTYSKNSKSSYTPPKKHFDEMTPQEIDEMLERLI
ncbi:MAG: hypothetical protein E7Z89_07060 [Cyanobacteria bacterium SIG28]|nr:hypothetical protein [Cyanobacteria bacterium SIG28]